MLFDTGSLGDFTTHRDVGDYRDVFITKLNPGGTALTYSTFLGAGGDRGSANYDVLSTTGQPTAIGVSSSSNYDDFAGFWYQVGEQAGVSIAPILELLLLD